MIIQIGTEVDESRILWKHKESDEWKRADIDDLIEAYEGRPKGKWHLVDHLWECDQCQYRQNKSKPTKFCPNCGSRMCREDSE